MTASTIEVPAVAAGAGLANGPERPQPSRARALLRSPVMVIGLTLVTILVVTAAFAPFIAPYNPRAVTGPPLHLPTAQHWLGTDIPGRDILSQLIYGARNAFVVAVVGSSLALVFGVLLGVLPTLLGGRTDSAANRFMVFMLALPGFPLIILIAALAGRSDTVILILVFTAGIWPNARILRSRTLSLRDAGYITAARGFGGGRLYVLRRHLLPGMGPLLMVRWVEWASTAVAISAGMAFLGLGDPSSASWGLMIQRSTSQAGFYFSPMWPWWALPPGFAIALTIMSFLFVGIALEPVFNPRWLRSA